MKSTAVGRTAVLFRFCPAAGCDWLRKRIICKKISVPVPDLSILQIIFWILLAETGDCWYNLIRIDGLSVLIRKRGDPPDKEKEEIIC